jgi:two-component system response regulator YesN
VAEKTGFSNQYYFSKVFKEHTGMGCKEYRDAAPPQL